MDQSVRGRIIKGLMLALIPVLILAGGTACKKTAEKVPPKETSKVAEKTEKPAPKPETEDLLAPVAKGYLDGAEFQMGATAEDVVAKLGEPQEEGWFSGYYMKYPKVLYFTDGMDRKNRGKVTMIMPVQGAEVYGLKIGASMAEVKKRFGIPNSDALADPDDELNEGQWELIYVRGDYQLSFQAPDREGKTTSAQIWKWNKK